MSNQINRWLAEAREHSIVGRTEAAERLCRKILDLVPEHPGAMLELGRSLYFQRALVDAIPYFDSVLKLQPGNSEARTMLLYSLIESGNHDRALELAHAIRAHSEDPDELLIAYLAFDSACDWEHAAQMQDGILELASKGRISNVQLSSLLMNLNAVPGIDPERMYEIHRVWGSRIEREARRTQLGGLPSQPQEGRLKVGYLSADFYQHPVGHFIQSLISFHDRNRFEVYCYARVVADDTRTARIRETTDHFIDVTQLSPAEMAQRIRDDGIHILIELGGHTAMTCLPALAFKPAPVQMTYLGYPNTTGLSTVDFRITDVYAEDTEHGTRYIEQLLYMPQSFLCATEFMCEVQRIETTPAAKNGHITFGSFNHVRKLNPETIALWSRILHQVEGSRLSIKSRSCDKPRIRDNLLAAFARHGIAADRIDFYASMEKHAEHTAIYNKVDIALDSFPYNGTTTTCETLWMGVPVVTLVGPQHVQRTSYSILKNIGLDATIAHTPDEYVEKAVALAKNTENLGILRQCLPTLFRHSPLGQAETFTRQMEALYLEAWQAKGFALPDANEQPVATDHTADENSLTPEMWTQRVEHALQAFRENQEDNEPLQTLRMLRAAFVQVWLASTPDQAMGTFNQFNQGYRKLLLSELRSKQLVQDEQTLVNELLALLQQEWSCQIVTMLMLYVAPHDLPSSPDTAALPDWFLEPYMDFKQTEIGAPQLQ